MHVCYAKNAIFDTCVTTFSQIFLGTCEEMYIYISITPGSERLDPDPHLFSEPVFRRDG